MIGSAFILHNNTWSCSNDVTYSVTNTPIFVKPGDMVPISVKQGQEIKVRGLFSPHQALQKGQLVEIAFKNEVNESQYAFSGEVQYIGDVYTIIKIFTKTDRIKEILSNITFKN